MSWRPMRASRTAGAFSSLGVGPASLRVVFLRTTCLLLRAILAATSASPVMIGLAKRCLEAYAERAQVVLSDGAVRFPLPQHSVDRVVSSYVLDLLSEADIERFFSESHRVMMPGGKVCIASLTRGVNVPSRIVASLWMSVFRLSPALVGGRRPIHVDAFVNPQEWQVVHRRVVTPFGVPSEGARQGGQAGVPSF